MMTAVGLLFAQPNGPVSSNVAGGVHAAHVGPDTLHEDDFKALSQTTAIIDTDKKESTLS